MRLKEKADDDEEKTGPRLMFIKELCCLGGVGHLWAKDKQLLQKLLLSASDRDKQEFCIQIPAETDKDDAEIR